MDGSAEFRTSTAQIEFELGLSLAINNLSKTPVKESSAKLDDQLFRKIKSKKLARFGQAKTILL